MVSLDLDSRERKEQMRGHGMHMWMCAAMVVGALVLVAVTGSGLALVPAIGCVLMMVVMMRMMGGMGGDSRRR
jgi:hypothetical protein